MARNVGNWLRWWVGTVSDPKLAAVALLAKQSRANVVAVWSCVLERGWCADDRGRPTELPADEFAACLDLPIESVEAVLEAMRAKRMLDGTSIANWDKRNPEREDEDAAERKRRQRDRSRIVTQGHEVSHNVTQGHEVSHNVTQGHAPDADAETDADTEAEVNLRVDEGESAQAPSPQPAKKSPARKSVDDEEWIRSVEKSDAYRDIDVRSVLSKMIVWCETRRQKPSRQRLLNWLNREHRPLGSSSATKSGIELFKEETEKINAANARRVRGPDGEEADAVLPDNPARPSGDA